MPGSYARVVRVADIPVGSKQAFDVGGKPVLVCHGEERWYAVSNLCSHAQQQLESGRMLRGRITCPLHGTRFDLATGKALNPPAREPIATYELRIIEDWVEILV
jgi:3-phenylpropionate/trans-cinnamate dioxygenase ferredoxin component